MSLQLTIFLISTSCRKSLPSPHPFCVLPNGITRGLSDKKDLSCFVTQDITRQQLPFLSPRCLQEPGTSGRVNALGLTLVWTLLSIWSDNVQNLSVLLSWTLLFLFVLEYKNFYIMVSSSCFIDECIQDHRESLREVLQSVRVPHSLYLLRNP